VVKLLVLAVLVVVASPAAAQPLTEPSAVLRESNAAATAGDWGKVSALVDPLLARQLAPTDLAEAQRLAGIAAFFQQRLSDAEAHFLAYLRLDLEGHLDLSLYPPEVVQFFDDVRQRHAPELRARGHKQKRYFAVSFVPVVSQFQNGERVKGIVLAGLIGAFAITNITSYLVLRSWCTPVSGGGGASVTCDNQGNHIHAANQLRDVNIASGIGAIAALAYGVYDGVVGYRNKEREEAMRFYVSPTSGGTVLGLGGTF
jgi:hypothetical protein